MLTEKRIMVGLDGSKDSIRGLRTAILFARQSDAMIVGVYVDTSQGAIRAMSAPKIKEEKWSKETRKVIESAKEKANIRGVKFEGIVIAGYKPGNDLANFANNRKNKIEQMVIGSRGSGFPKERFLGSTANFILHKAKVPVTVVK